MGNSAPYLLEEAKLKNREEVFYVFSAMRNEGAFLLEWVCWYRALGFRILIGINDCTDRSGRLLNALKSAGWIDFFRHVPPQGVPPKRSAHKALRRRHEVELADWLFICDVDEFLVLHNNCTSIQKFVDVIGRMNLGVAFHWKTFGNSENHVWRDGFVHMTFTKCGPSQSMPNASFKTMIHNPRRFGKFSEHSPRDFDGDWGALPNNIVDCCGVPIEEFLFETHPVKETAIDRISHGMAQLNHYVIKSDESFNLKRGTLSASAFRDRYTQTFYERRNINTSCDISAGHLHQNFLLQYQEAIQLPDVAKSHHLCCMDYVVRLCHKANKNPLHDPRYLWHMDQARVIELK